VRHDAFVQVRAPALLGARRRACAGALPTTAAASAAAAAGVGASRAAHSRPHPAAAPEALRSNELSRPHRGGRKTARGRGLPSAGVQRTPPATAQVQRPVVEPRPLARRQPFPKRRRVQRAAARVAPLSRVPLHGPTPVRNGHLKHLDDHPDARRLTRRHANARLAPSDPEARPRLRPVLRGHPKRRRRRRLVVRAAAAVTACTAATARRRHAGRAKDERQAGEVAQPVVGKDHERRGPAVHRLERTAQRQHAATRVLEHQPPERGPLRRRASRRQPRVPARAGPESGSAKGLPGAPGEGTELDLHLGASHVKYLREPALAAPHQRAIAEEQHRAGRRALGCRAAAARRPQGPLQRLGKQRPKRSAGERVDHQRPRVHRRGDGGGRG